MERYESIAAAAASLVPPQHQSNLRYYVRKSKEFLGFRWSYADPNAGVHRFEPLAPSRPGDCDMLAAHADDTIAHADDTGADSTNSMAEGVKARSNHIQCKKCRKKHPKQHGQYCGECRRCFHHKKMCEHLKPGRATTRPNVGGNVDSFVTHKDQGWGLLLDFGLVKPGDFILPPGGVANKDRKTVVQDDGTLSEDGRSWRDPVAFLVRNNGWRQFGEYLKHRNRFSNCTRSRPEHLRVEDGDDAAIKLSELKHRARKQQGFVARDEGKLFRGSSECRLPANSLKPVIGSVVNVRCDVASHEPDDDDSAVEWFPGKITDYNQDSREWTIKLDVCDNPDRADEECTGCSECMYQLAFETKAW